MRIAIVVLVLLAGCSQPGALDQAEAEAQADAAVERLAADFGELGTGDLTRLRADFAVDDDDLGAGHFVLDLEWGQNDATHMLLELASDGGFSIGLEIEAWCTNDGMVMAYDGIRYEGRTAECGEWLGEDLSGDALDFAPLEADALEGLDQVEVTPNADGSITAVYQDDEGQLTFRIVDGRITNVDIASDEGNGTMTFTYGTPRVLTLPAADERLPSSVGGFCFFFDGACTYDAWGGDEAPLSDFEVRIQDDDATVAVFQLSPGEQTAGDYGFHFEDDGDGLFGDGDRFTVTGPEADVVVWDLWADRSVDDHPIPGPSVLAILALLGLVAILRR